jgi:hypothetical protein
LCNKARARIFENLHLFTFLRAHSAERFFALDCAASTQSRANPFWPLGRRRQRPLSATQSPALRLQKFRETALFSVSNGEQAVRWRIYEAVDYAQLTQTSALTPFRPVSRVRIHLPPPRSLQCREIPLLLTPKYAKYARFSRFFLKKPDWRE